MIVIETKWYDLGADRVLQKPVPGALAFASYCVYLAGRYLGRQASAPTLTDCQSMERTANEERRVLRFADRPKQRLRGVAKVNSERKAAA